jgi:hypothetical protein
MPDRGPIPNGTTTDPGEPQVKRARGPLPARRRKAALSVAEASDGMLVRQVSVRAVDVVFVKGIIEASDGLAIVFAERGGELTIAAPKGRGAELAELLQDVATEVSGRLDAAQPSDAAFEATPAAPLTAPPALAPVDVR